MSTMACRQHSIVDLLLGPSRTVSLAPGILSWTISSLWVEISESLSMARSASSASSSGAADAAVDVDSRADAFIANFWRHIQMEQQVSLELQYCREWPPPPVGIPTQTHMACRGGEICFMDHLLTASETDKQATT
ncbi:hypothetical protein Taro_025730 [Colocasia esculenta]|uniref:Uncharacterized protein n=1 Tax=Colocasia esculenta TaxID=4460 RepID=A0A843VIF7_COLES|nr:hypothetical protein [Colocasia esculenta]